MYTSKYNFTLEMFSFLEYNKNIGCSLLNHVTLYRFIIVSFLNLKLHAKEICTLQDVVMNLCLHTTICINAVISQKENNTSLYTSGLNGETLTTHTFSY